MSEQPVRPAKAPYPREPSAYPGGEQEPGGLVPPYEGRKTESSGEQEQAGGSDPTQRSAAAGPREVSQAEREGVSPTDATAASPHGAGVSTSTQGNVRMHGSSTEAQKADQLDSGVGGRTENIDPESPTVMTGDQGG